MRLLASIALGLACLCPPSALAEDDAYRYGYQTAIMDMSAASIVGVGLALEEPVVIGTGALAFVAGATMVHIAQRNYEGTLISASLRISLPALLGLAGVGIVGVQNSSRDQAQDRDFLDSAAPGLVVGALLAAVLDAQIFAERERRPGDAGFRIAPLLGRRHWGLSLQGRL